MAFDGWTDGAIKKYKQMEREYYTLGLSGKDEEAKQNWREAKAFYDFQNEAARRKAAARE